MRETKSDCCGLIRNRTSCHETLNIRALSPIGQKIGIVPGLLSNISIYEIEVVINWRER